MDLKNIKSPVPSLHGAAAQVKKGDLRSSTFLASPSLASPSLASHDSAGGAKTIPYMGQRIDPKSPLALARAQAARMKRIIEKTIDPETGKPPDRAKVIVKGPGHVALEARWSPACSDLVHKQLASAGLVPTRRRKSQDPTFLKKYDAQTPLGIRQEVTPRARALETDQQVPDGVSSYVPDHGAGPRTENSLKKLATLPIDRNFADNLQSHGQALSGRYGLSITADTPGLKDGRFTLMLTAGDIQLRQDDGETLKTQAPPKDILGFMWESFKNAPDIHAMVQAGNRSQVRAESEARYPALTTPPSQTVAALNAWFGEDFSLPNGLAGTIFHAAYAQIKDLGSKRGNSDESDGGETSKLIEILRAANPDEASSLKRIRKAEKARRKAAKKEVKGTEQGLRQMPLDAAFEAGLSKPVEEIAETLGVAVVLDKATIVDGRPAVEGRIEWLPIAGSDGDGAEKMEAAPDIRAKVAREVLNSFQPVHSVSASGGSGTITVVSAKHIPLLTRDPSRPWEELIAWARHRLEPPEGLARWLVHLILDEIHRGHLDASIKWEEVEAVRHLVRGDQRAFRQQVDKLVGRARSAPSSHNLHFKTDKEVLGYLSTQQGFLNFVNEVSLTFFMGGVVEDVLTRGIGSSSSILAGVVIQALDQTDNRRDTYGAELVKRYQAAEGGGQQVLGITMPFAQSEEVSLTHYFYDDLLLKPETQDIQLMGRLIKIVIKTPEHFVFGGAENPASAYEGYFQQKYGQQSLIGSLADLANRLGFSEPHRAWPDVLLLQYYQDKRNGWIWETLSKLLLSAFVPGRQLAILELALSTVVEQKVRLAEQELANRGIVVKGARPSAEYVRSKILERGE